MVTVKTFSAGDELYDVMQLLSAVQACTIHAQRAIDGFVSREASVTVSASPTMKWSLSRTSPRRRVEYPAYSYLQISLQIEFGPVGMWTPAVRTVVHLELGCLTPEACRQGNGIPTTTLITAARRR